MRREHNIQSGLPSGYREIEYIESTGAQYIDTNFPASSTLNISFNVYIIDKVWPYDSGYYTSFAGNRDGYNGLYNTQNSGREVYIKDVLIFNKVLDLQTIRKIQGYE